MISSHVFSLHQLVSTDSPKSFFSSILQLKNGMSSHQHGKFPPLTKFAGCTKGLMA